MLLPPMQHRIRAGLPAAHQICTRAIVQFRALASPALRRDLQVFSPAADQWRSRSSTARFETMSPEPPGWRLSSGRDGRRRSSSWYLLAEAGSRSCATVCRYSRNQSFTVTLSPARSSGCSSS